MYSFGDGELGVEHMGLVHDRTISEHYQIVVPSGKLYLGVGRHHRQRSSAAAVHFICNLFRATPGFDSFSYSNPWSGSCRAHRVSSCRRLLRICTGGLH
jgi:hypothetical protein